LIFLHRLKKNWQTFFRLPFFQREGHMRVCNSKRIPPFMQWIDSLQYCEGFPAYSADLRQRRKSSLYEQSTPYLLTHVNAKHERKLKINKWIIITIIEINKTKCIFTVLSFLPQLVEACFSFFTIFLSRHGFKQFSGAKKIHQRH